MGEVDPEQETNLLRDVAVEILLATWAQDHLAAFGRKLEALAVNHPCLAIIHGLIFTAPDARATGEKEAYETTPV